MQPFENIQKEIDAINSEARRAMDAARDALAILALAETRVRASLADAAEIHARLARLVSENKT